MTVAVDLHIPSSVSAPLFAATLPSAPAPANDSKPLTESSYSPPPPQQIRQSSGSRIIDGYIGFLAAREKEFVVIASTLCFATALPGLILDCIAEGKALRPSEAQLFEQMAKSLNDVFNAKGIAKVLATARFARAYSALLAYGNH